MNTIDKLQAFANKHGLILEQKGQCGFGRPCVGFIAKNGSYLDHNPLSYGNDYKEIFPYDDRLLAPEGVQAYHKHDCMAVLAQDENYEAALEQLLKWVESLESHGEMEVVEYPTGATGFQLMVSGLVGYALKYRQPKEQAA